jgi:hypothetical protein
MDSATVDSQIEVVKSENIAYYINRPQQMFLEGALTKAGLLVQNDDRP